MVAPHRRPRAPAALPWAWRLGFAAVVVTLIVFAAWSVLLVVRVRTLRGEVERNVAWLQRTGELQRGADAWRDAPPPPDAPAWQAAAEALAALADEAAEHGRDDLADPLAAATAALAQARVAPATLPAAQARLDALVRTLRADNASRSARLGASWDDLVLVVFTALLLAALDIVLLAQAERRRREAQRLAAEIEATADELAETRAALREREAVARLADELRRARDRAEEASAAKTRFLMRMSHEVLTPLNIISGYAALARERCDELGAPDLAGDLDRVEGGARDLFRMLRRVLDLSELDAGAAVLTPTDVALAPLLARLADEARPVAARNGTALALDLPDAPRLECDAARLETIVSELLGNACRFTRGGHVTLSARADADHVLLEIRDDGPGMTASDLERATTPFFQSDDSTTRRHDGAGLGLAVADRLCARMGGALTVTSAPGAGTTATVRLPARAPA